MTIPAVSKLDKLRRDLSAAEGKLATARRKNPEYDGIYAADVRRIAAALQHAEQEALRQAGR